MLMSEADEGLRNISIIFTEFGDFCKKRGQVNEADTRAKVIDRILKEALGWPEDALNRELPVHPGFLDYMLQTGKRRHCIIEAKREGMPFDVPKSLKTRKRYKISGSIKTAAEIKEAIEQAHYYCVETAVRYAVVTNGYAWLIFRAIREDIPWRDGDVIVFPGAGYIKDNFTAFWNLLSYPAVLDGSLDSLFSQALTVITEVQRPIELLRQPDAHLQRNRFHMHLLPFIDGVFRDIWERGQGEMFEKCYVVNRILRIIDDDFKLVIEDTIPRHIESLGTKETQAGFRDAGSMGEKIKQTVIQGKPRILLLLGGIGCGKTTYINRFFKYIAKDFMDQNAFWFYIDFLTPPTEDKLELHVKNSLLSQLREKYGHLNLESRDALLAAYDDKITILRHSIIDAEQLNEGELTKRLNHYLEKWMENVFEYVPRVIRNANTLGKSIIICIDNVDQLSPSYQANIFHLTHLISKEMNATSILALREESYHAVSTRKAFTAYNTNLFHIASPPFMMLMSLRLKYAREMLALPDDEIIIKLGTGLTFDKKEISKFLNIIEYSIFTKNKNIIRFIESLAFGNMREALDMFATFVYSGATNIDKMLKIYDRDDIYFVPYHEFAKSVILGERRYYRDSASKVVNLFEFGQERNSSYFTRLRLLSLLLAHASDSSSEGMGFVTLDYVYSSFLDIFDNEQDLSKAISHLLSKQLLQVNTRATDTIEGATHIRISSSGWYYYKYLVRAFAYLDLVFHDTPIKSITLAHKLKQYIIDVDALSDIQENMQERISLRFERTNAFLDYLADEEEKEHSIFLLRTDMGILATKFMPGIISQFRKEQEWIGQRVTKNADKQSDESLEFDDSILDLKNVTEQGEDLTLF